MSLKNQAYVHTHRSGQLPRLPLEGAIDLTYRCNNRCRHCWLWEADIETVQKKELTFEEIRRIVDEARALGCREWSISGGEPMLRPDFPEIFDYITRHSPHGYGLNTNGTLITPEIAQLMTRKGSKIIAIYGATAEVYDHITRNPGGFEQMMQGFSYLKEAGAGFTIQLVPLKDNLDQWDEMVALAKSLSSSWKTSSPWMFMSASGSAARNQEIMAQRIPPARVIQLDPPLVNRQEQQENLGMDSSRQSVAGKDHRLFAQCIENRRDFHVDAYGGMSWCIYIKDPALRYDLRQGSVQDAWENFIPSMADKVCGDQEWVENCGSCELRDDCRWCGAYAYLETGRFSAPIPYLCEITKEGQKYMDEWKNKHRRYFQVAGLTVRVDSDLDLTEVFFRDKIYNFGVDGPGDDNITISQHFELPDLVGKDLGEVIYRRLPWQISRKDGNYFYRGIVDGMEDMTTVLAIFNEDHTQATVYVPVNYEESVRKTGMVSLSLLPSDQLWLCPVVADRQGVLMHSAAAIVNGQGLVFVGHSEAGKSTTMEMLMDADKKGVLEAEVLCDDRNVIRKWPEKGWQVYGTWSHGTVEVVSPSSAPLSGIFFLEKSAVNQIDPITDKKLIWTHLLSKLIRGLVTAEWWQKELDILEEIVSEVPFYRMQFDKTGDIVPLLAEMSSKGN